MTRASSAFACAVLAVVTAIACSTTPEPEMNGGGIVLQFNPGQSMLAPSSQGALVTFDSVVVRVFRPAPGVNQEAAKGVAMSGAPTQIAIGCIAENHKRVSVELFNSRVMLYHGVNTDVNVVAGAQSQVNVDAYEFLVDTLEVSPTTVASGASFNLAWDRAAAATSYLVQSSRTPGFETIEWEQSAIDTTIDYASTTGMHYFRVIPRTAYAHGHAHGPKPGYVSGGSGQLTITGLAPSRVIPGETFTIVGENLDFPGTTANISGMELPVVRASWDSLVVVLPRKALTGKVSATSGSLVLGSDTSTDALVALRVAYVTAAPASAAASGYINLLERYSDDFGSSGVVALPLAQLDERDMSVFDIIIVAADTGTLKVNWGGDPRRASAIADSDANVLAIGKGGSVFLDLVAAGASVPSTSSADPDRKYFKPDQSAQIFDTPHSVGGGADLQICQSGTSASTVALDIASPAPAGVSLYASTDKSCLILCAPNDKWALADFRFNNPGGTPVTYFFWGFAGAPGDLTSDGEDCLGNVMYMLYAP